MATEWEEQKRNKEMVEDWLSLANSYNTIHRARLGPEIVQFSDHYYHEIMKYAKLLGGLISVEKEFGSYKVTKE